jgi:cell division protein FtsZ
MINVRMQHKDVQTLTPKITVVGVGGAGGNAVNNMISSGLQGCEFLVCNTDAQALEGSMCENKMQLGVTVTGGLGAGAKPEIGRAAAEESLDDVLQYLEGSNMAFITAGMGGGTGTGAAPIIARAAREKGILTVGVVTKPFHFEGTWRMKMAEEGIEEMQDYVDTLIVIPNQNLFRIANEKTTFAEAFKMADSVLQSGVRGVTDLMVMPGLINLDFADIRSAMLEMGKTMMGTGEAEGDKRAVEAAESAINNPLLDDVSMKGARGVIINVTGGMDMTLFEVDEACNRIRDEVDPNANIIFGSTFDDSLEGIMRVSVVATGIDVAEEKAVKPTVRTSVTTNVNSQAKVSSKFERAQPNTEPQQESNAVTEQAATVTPQQAVPQKFTAPVAPPSAPVSAAHSGAVQNQVSGSAPVSEQVFRTPQASIYKESFIPPKPVEPDYAAVRQAEVASSPAPQPSVQQSTSTESASPLSATRPQVQESSPQVSTPALNLRPPVPGGSAQTQVKKRTPSLFERFTGPLRGHGDVRDEEGGEKGSASGSASSGGFGSLGLRATPQSEQQGSLNIDPPKKEAGTDDELDIPAFLRRQAN